MLLSCAFRTWTTILLARCLLQFCQNLGISFQQGNLVKYGMTFSNTSLVRYLPVEKTKCDTKLCKVGKILITKCSQATEKTLLMHAWQQSRITVQSWAQWWLTQEQRVTGLYSGHEPRSLREFYATQFREQKFARSEQKWQSAGLSFVNVRSSFLDNSSVSHTDDRVLGTDI